MIAQRRWTIHFADGATAIVDGPLVGVTDPPVEVVPVPDEQAIERAAKILPMFHPDDAREIVREIAAALERPE